MTLSFPAGGNLAAELLTPGQADAEAVVDGHRRVSYAELRHWVRRLAKALHQAGARPGDRIGISGRNSPAFVATYLAAVWGGQVAVPIPETASERMRRDLVDITEMFCLVTAPDPNDAIPAECGCPILREPELTASATAAMAEPWPAADDDPAAVMFTSGSTAAPKGVIVTHGNIRCNTRDILSYMKLDATDRVMVVLPFSYCFGLSLLHTHLAVGASVVLASHSILSAKLFAEFNAAACSGLAGVPSTYQLLLWRNRLGEQRLPTLRWLQQAGGKMAPALVQELRQAFPEVRLYLMYGQTEATARLSYLPLEYLDTKAGSVGRGLPSTSLQVLNADARPVRPDNHEVGEIVAAGGNISPGYWRDPVETAKVFRDGRLYTGDLATMDADGFIYIIGRERQFLKPFGIRTSPQAIEEVLLGSRRLTEAAVVGVPTPMSGDEVVAFIGAEESPKLVEDLMAYCREHLPSHAIPQRIHCLKAFPRTASGKPDLSALREAAFRLRGRPPGPC